MSHTSLHTRDSALSPHALSIMLPLLRRIALWHRDRVAELRPEPDAERLDALALPLELRINAPYSAKPAASLMSSTEIAKALSEGHDPWAEEAETWPVSTTLSGIFFFNRLPL